MLLQHRPESISKSAAQDLTFVIKHPLRQVTLYGEGVVKEGLVVWGKMLNFVVA